MKTLTLTKKPEALVFAGSELKALKDHLAANSKHTLIMPILSPGDLLLNPDTGMTTSGFTYTDVALHQISTFVSKGLASIVTDIAGQWRKAGEDMRFFSGIAAVEIFNRLLKLRFERKLNGMQIVKNTKEKTIDGIVGARYRFLPNDDFTGRVSELLKNTEYVFTAAYLYGRQLCLRYVAKNYEKYTYAAGTSRVLPGVHFANTEIGGTSIRTAGLLQLPESDYFALGPFKEGTGGRVIHSGKGFERRLSNLLAAAPKNVPSRSLIELALSNVKNKPLGLGGKNHHKLVRHLVTMLRRRRVSHMLATRIIHNTVAKGADSNSGILDLMPAERTVVLQQRSVYDLIITLMQEAVNLPIAQRETVEQIAYSLLVGKISVN